mgnify:CR=1 FL=1
MRRDIIIKSAFVNKNYFNEKKYHPNDNFIKVAEKFAYEITEQCILNKSYSKTIKVMYLNQKLFSNEKTEDIV